jgi:predicted nucleic acid-binding protein
MPVTLLLDTGPWVALHCRDDRHHTWAREQFSHHSGPFVTCEAVVAETCIRLARGGHDPAKALALVERGVVQIGMRLADEVPAVKALCERFGSVPMSLADACLVRMSELYQRCLLLTLDGDFRTYRRFGRRVIPLACP